MGADLEFFEGAWANIVGVDVAGRAEESGELEGFAAGARTGVEPTFAGGDAGGGEDHLRAEVLDFDEAGEEGFGFGDVGFGKEFHSAGHNAGNAGWPTEAGEFRENGSGVGSLEAEPKGGAGMERVEIGGQTGRGAMAREPRG